MSETIRELEGRLHRLLDEEMRPRDLRFVLLTMGPLNVNNKAEVRTYSSAPVEVTLRALELVHQRLCEEIALDGEDERIAGHA